jgi:phosphoribosylanthranilate isomerase
MALKTLVKVGKISNLSDARYCAGMSVDMLGFSVINGRENYVSPELFKEMRGWFTGPSIVAEIYGIEKHEDLAAIFQAYLPDLVEGSFSDIKKLHSAFASYILSTTYEEVKAHEDELGIYRTQIAYLIIPESTPMDQIETLSREYKLLLRIDSMNPEDSKLHNTHIKGIALQGSSEDKPGLKNYDALASVLEKLEAED